MIIYLIKIHGRFIDMFHVPSGYDQRFAMGYCRWPIEIDGLPIKNGGSFHG